MKLWWFALTILLNDPRNANGLYGYDCGDHLSNLTTISLIDVGDCEVHKPELDVSRNYGQLLQVNDYTSTHIYKCAIKVNRVVTHCGMHRHVSRVLNGELGYFKALSASDCRNIQTTQSYLLGKTRIDKIRRNGTTIRPIILAGHNDKEGYCKGESYSDDYGDWEGVYVAGQVEIVLQDYSTPVHLESNRIILKSGVRCAFKELECIDHDGAQVFWEQVPEDFCGLKAYSVLYEGYMDRINDTENKKIMYSVESGDRTFALWKKGEITKCGYKFYSTEHPKLFLIEDIRKQQFIEKVTIDTVNLDMFAYVNSKFLYIEKHISGQIQEMYYKILKQECEIERKVLKNAISIATLSPEQFGYRLMEENGYIGVVAGEVVHLVKCIRVEVQLRNTTKCYAQLPVKRGNEDLFLSSQTRILVRTATELSCDPRIPAMFQLGQKWYKMLPMPVEASEPETLKPQTKPTWKYMSPDTLAIGGIYGEKDLTRLRDMILFPVEKPAVLNQIAQGMTGKGGKQEGIGIMNLFDEQTMQELVNDTWERMWSTFLTFGTASAGVIGLLLIFRVVKLLVDTIIHGYAIYSLYGFSVHLIGSIWNSVTQLLLHLGTQQENVRRNAENTTHRALENVNEPLLDPPVQMTESEKKASEAPPKQEEEGQIPTFAQLYPDIQQYATIRPESR